MKTTVIYHSADYDGIFCREIARKFLPDAELIGWDFSDPPLMAIHPGFNQSIYVMDLPIDKPFGMSAKSLPDWVFTSVTWIDHHKSAIESHPKEIPGYRIDGVAACRLAWQWFGEHAIANRTGEAVRLPEKQAFVDRIVSEPLAVRLAGEYDIWDKRDINADTFQYALRASPITPVGWAALFDDDKAFVNQLLVDGRTCQRYAQSIDADLVTHKSYRMKWEGLNFLVLNTGRFNSLTFSALDKPNTGHDALLGYMFNGKVWTVSLYHAKHRTDLDLSTIAVKHGGGGHKGACGFTCAKLPF